MRTEVELSLDRGREQPGIVLPHVIRVYLPIGAAAKESSSDGGSLLLRPTLWAPLGLALIS